MELGCYTGLGNCDTREDVIHSRGRPSTVPFPKPVPALLCNLGVVAKPLWTCHQDMEISQQPVL